MRAKDQSASCAIPEFAEPYIGLEEWDQATLLAAALGHQVMSNTIWFNGHDHLERRGDKIGTLVFWPDATVVIIDWLTRSIVP